MTGESPYEKKKQPKKIEVLLDSLLHKLSGSTSQDITEILENWELIIGGPLSKLSSPTHIKNQICTYRSLILASQEKPSEKAENTKSG